jgi:beta-1,4-mannosyl-glycoprotein beta-1,4-N-acetylglucosaminyltransferase
MIYDCFAFFNELDLLEIRLQDLSPVVDKFVLVEATRTFQKNPKPLYYQENKERFKRFHHQIIHIIVDEYPTFFTRWRVPQAWDYDNHQKEQILRGLSAATPDDNIIISDIDEFPRPDKIIEYKDVPGIKIFEQFLCFYYVNNLCTFQNVGSHGELKPSPLNRDGFGFWRGSVMLKKKDLKTIKKGRLLRDLPDDKATIIREGGWHFSYLGGVEKIIEKIEAWAHPEFNTPEYKNPEKIRQMILEGASLFDPHTRFHREDIKNPRFPFPKPLTENPEKYAHLILN